jgi:hypothetical protein
LRKLWVARMVTGVLSAFPESAGRPCLGGCRPAWFLSPSTRGRNYVACGGGGSLVSGWGGGSGLGRRGLRARHGAHRGVGFTQHGVGRMLVGRTEECAQLRRLLSAALGGRSGALVVTGEAGVGKSALLEYAVAARRLDALGRLQSNEPRAPAAEQWRTWHVHCRPFIRSEPSTRHEPGVRPHFKPHRGAEGSRVKPRSGGGRVGVLFVRAVRVTPVAG